MNDLLLNLPKRQGLNLCRIVWMSLSKHRADFLVGGVGQAAVYLGVSIPTVKGVVWPDQYDE